MDFFIPQVPTPLATRILLCAKPTLAQVNTLKEIFNLRTVRLAGSGSQTFSITSPTHYQLHYDKLSTKLDARKDCQWYMYVETKTVKKHLLYRLTTSIWMKLLNHVKQKHSRFWSRSHYWVCVADINFWNTLPDRMIGSVSGYSLNTQIIRRAKSSEYMNWRRGFPVPHTVNLVLSSER